MRKKVILPLILSVGLLVPPFSIESKPSFLAEQSIENVDCIEITRARNIFNVEIQEDNSVENVETVEIEVVEEEIVEEVYYNIQYWTFEVSYYCGCWSCTQNGDLTTASGTTATQYRTIAAPKDVPFGSEIYIEGLGTFICEDRGGYIEYTYDEYGNLIMRLDVYLENHNECYERGRHYADGYIIIND